MNVENYVTKIGGRRRKPALLEQHDQLWLLPTGSDSGNTVHVASAMCLHTTDQCVPKI